jgi:hypothetical protein
MAKGKSTRHRRYDGTCSGCAGPRDREGQRYCRPCHAAYMRAHRPKHSELTPLQKYKANCRSHANTAQKRGILKPQACEVCGDKAQKHHDDYRYALKVRWLCRPCHLWLHQNSHQNPIHPMWLKPSRRKRGAAVIREPV